MKPIRRTPLRRYKAPNKKRPTLRRGQPSAEEIHEMRVLIYEKSGGRCELHLLPTCKTGVLPFDGDLLERWHLVHVRHRRRFGWPTEGPFRMRGGCYECHIRGMHHKGLKPTFNEEA